MRSPHLEETPPSRPVTLSVPAGPPCLIYLDMNHWIELAKVHSGRLDNKTNRDTLDACINAVSDGKAVFPLSIYIYTEIAKINNYRQRYDLRKAIEQVCRFFVVTCPTVVATHEIEALLDQTVGPNPSPLNTTNYLDWGVSRAFGKAGDLRIQSINGEDITESVRQKWPLGPEVFDNILFNAQLELNRKVIDGPSPGQEPDLKSLGWNPQNITQGFERKASDEIAQVQRFDEHPTYRVRQTRDVISARTILNEVWDIFDEGFAAREPSLIDRFFAVGTDDFRSLVRGTPSLDVEVTLKTSLHRDFNHKWTNNDIYDIKALALTIPYCDVVVTDRSMWSHVTRHKLPQRYNTVVFSRLEELQDHLLSL